MVLLKLINTTKTFIISIGNKQTKVSIDRVKSEYLKNIEYCNYEHDTMKRNLCTDKLTKALIKLSQWKLKNRVFRSFKSHGVNLISYVDNLRCRYNKTPSE